LKCLRMEVETAVKDKKWKLLLIGIIIVSLVAAGYAAWQRYVLERQHRSVALAVVYDEVAALARMNGLTTRDALEKYKARGVTAVLIKEPTVREAQQNGEFTLRTGQELLALGDPDIIKAFGSAYPGDIQNDLWYFVFTDEQIFERVKGQLSAKIAPAAGDNVNDPGAADRSGTVGKGAPSPAADGIGIPETAGPAAPVSTASDNDGDNGVRALREWRGSGVYILETAYDWGLLEQMGVGFPARAVEDVQAAGLKTYVQLRTWNQVNYQGLHYVFDQISQIPNLAGVLFNDPVLPGVPDLIRPLAYEMQKLDVPVVQIEFSNQVGLSRLGLLLDKNVVRLHTLTPAEDAKKNYSVPAMVDRFALAASERNIRVLLLHSYMKTNVPDVLQMNLDLAEKTRDTLAAEGLQVGDAAVLPPLAVSRWLLFVMGLGVIAGEMLLTHTMGWGRAAPYLGLLALLLWVALLAAGQVSPGRKLMAFAAVVIFPTLSLALHVKRGGSSPGRAVALLLRTSLYSLVGALLMVGLLADKGFMLKLDQFAGVKLAHVVPLLLLSIIFFFRGDEDGGGWQRQLKRFLEQPILVKFAVVGGILLVALLVYVSRTGNESAAISPLELKFRALLDNLLGVRPRTKEFFLGHPLLVLLFYLGYRNNNYMPLLLLGAIGQISLVNTYAHIHTPLAISLMRSFNGLWLGIAGGLLLIALWRIFKKGTGYFSWKL